MKPRIVVSLLLLCLAALPGCGVRSRGTNEQGQTVLRSVSWAATPTEERIIQGLVAEFNRRNPTIHVVHQIISQGYSSVLLTSFASGNAPDVFWVSSGDAHSYIARHVLYDITPFIEEEAVEVDDFFPATLAPYRKAERYYALPNDACSVAVFYNRELFDRAGLRHPGEEWDWNEFAEAAKILTQDRDGDGRPDQWGFAIPGDVLMVLPFIYSVGGDLFDSDDPDKPLFDQPDALTAMDRVYQLALREKVAPLRGEAGDQAARRGFQLGRTAMMISGWWDMTETDLYAPDLDYGLAPIPKVKQGASQAYSTGTAIYAGSPHAREAWMFVQFMTGFEGQLVRCRERMAGPSRRSVGRDPYFEGREKDRVFLESIEYARGSYGEHFNIMQDELVQAQDRVLQELQTTEEAFVQAKRSFLRRIKQ